jgi:hypothetical protein
VTIARPFTIALFAATACGERMAARPDVVAAAAPLCVEAGQVRGGIDAFEVDSPGVRATVPGASGQAAEIVFTYRSPSSRTVPLANGERRRQIGLKLRAKDTCNVLYVMWRFEPAPGIAVSVKYNPLASTHAACGAGGYLTSRPAWSRPVAPVREGETHALRAELDGTHLRVAVDGEVAWTGSVREEVLAFDGPSGVRSDNVAFRFFLRTRGVNANSTKLPFDNPVLRNRSHEENDDDD